MTPQVVYLPTGLTVGDALEHVRRNEPDAETIYAVPVVGAGRHVEGVISLRRLLVTESLTPVAEVMSEPITVEAEEDQEVAARLVRDQGLVAVPVVDAERWLLGVFTVDDAMRALEAEESEDIARSAATAPLRRPYLTTTVLEIVRSRIIWLLVALALFVPPFIGTAGNTGAQAATTVVRAMAVGDVRFSEMSRVVGREILVGILLGAALATVGFIPATLVAGSDIAIVLALPLVVVCTLATTAARSPRCWPNGSGSTPPWSAPPSSPRSSTPPDSSSTSSSPKPSSG